MEQTDDMTIISTRLVKAMHDSALNGSQLAEKIGVTRSAMSLFLSGKRRPGRMVLAKMADELSVTVDFLLGRGDGINVEELLENPTIVRLVRDFTELSEQGRQRVLSMIESIKQTDHTEGNSPRPEIIDGSPLREPD